MLLWWPVPSTNLAPEHKITYISGHVGTTIHFPEDVVHLFCFQVFSQRFVLTMVKYSSSVTFRNNNLYCPISKAYWDSNSFSWMVNGSSFFSTSLGFRRGILFVLCIAHIISGGKCPHLVSNYHESRIRPTHLSNNSVRQSVVIDINTTFFFDAFHDILDILSASSWYLTARWTVPKSSSIVLRLLFAMRCVDFSESSIHRKAWQSILFVRYDPSRYGGSTKSAHTAAKFSLCVILQCCFASQGDLKQ